MAGRGVAHKIGVLSKLCRLSNRSYFTYVREPSHFIKGKEPKWVTADKAFEALESGNLVFAQGAAATPITLLKAMTEHGKANKLKDVGVCHMHTEGHAPYTEPDCEGIFRSLSFFMGGNVRKAVADGRSDAIPIFLHEIPHLFTRDLLHPDIAVIHVSPPDQHGYCSLGTSVDCVRAALTKSKYIVAQVNKQMPRTFGDSLIHISHIDYAVNIDEPLPQHPSKKQDPVEMAIGKHIAENLVVDGATLQMGIGSIPDAVLSMLTNHKNLGIHTEMFSDGVVDLYYKGCITNNLKSKYHKGRFVVSFLIGTQKLYDFVDNNPAIEVLTVDYVNSTEVVASQNCMTAINSCIEVDLTGQVVSDSIGTRMYSGFGGQVDFIRGAAQAYDGKGKAIIALPSVTKKGESKIVNMIKPGAGVTTSRAHVHYVVTEHGIAYLFGKSLRQRAHALIQIAHPDHRAALEKAAFERLKVMPSP
ncbi:hypothetical protein HHI36_007802 [Cryptolaemus montrouzieri]|uniref:Acetyl-CoA hydrolase n=1 Tax=Cryptolaemus montrouzieri TaxID=559131 RepID=A0ABD2MR25_9CUCU